MRAFALSSGRDGAMRTAAGATSHAKAILVCNEPGAIVRDCAAEEGQAMADRKSRTPDCRSADAPDALSLHRRPICRTSRRSRRRCRTRRPLRPADSGIACGDRCRTATNRTLRSWRATSRARTCGPQSICVTIRGTDVDITDIWGILEQIWEDLDASDPQPMPWALNDPARLRRGTLDGLAIIQGLTAQSGNRSASF